MDLKIGKQVRIHPDTDLFKSRGVRFATITKVGRVWVHLFHHESQTTHRVPVAGVNDWLANPPVPFPPAALARLKCVLASSLVKAVAS